MDENRASKHDLEEIKDQLANLSREIKRVPESQAGNILSIKHECNIVLENVTASISSGFRS